MLLPFNPYSIHELVAIMVSGSVGLAVGTAWLISHRQGTSRPVFAFYQLLVALAMVLFFLQDNLVPQGLSSTGWKGGPDARTLASRSTWVALAIWQSGLLITVVRLHFALIYTASRNWLRRHCWLLYAATALAMAAMAFGGFFEPRSEPMAPTGGWHCRVPWMPDPGPMAHVYLGAWLVAHASTLWILGRHARRSSAGSVGALPGSKVIFWAFTADVLLVTPELVSNFIGWTTPALTPVGVAISGTIVGITLLRHHRSADRIEGDLNDLQQQMARLRQEERRDLAKEVYESLRRNLSQLHLTLLGGSLESARSQRQRSGRLVEAIQQSRELTGKIRRICYGLFPPKLEQAGLAAAVDQLVQHWRREGIDVTVSFGPDMVDYRFPRALEFFLYRFCQQVLGEALFSGRAVPLEVLLSRRSQSLQIEFFDSQRPSSLHRVPEKLADLCGQIDRLGGTIETFGREGGTVLLIRISQASGTGIPGSMLSTAGPARDA
jgi:signal transduction histidine kinase